MLTRVPRGPAKFKCIAAQDAVEMFSVAWCQQC